MEKMRRNKGITLISLVVTIIILIILAGVTINILLGKNGVIEKTKEAKTGTEIGREKEILQLALGDIATGNEGKLNFNKESLEKALRDNSGIEGITAQNSGGLLYIVTFPDSKRQYEVYADGTVTEGAPKVKDTTPGEITKKDDNTYLIQSIEDLVILSNTVNARTDNYEGKTFEIQCDLNFASVNSYINPEGNNFGDANGDGTEEATLIAEMTTGAGFIPIGYGYRSFKGNIEGNGHTISNLYINRNGSCQGLIGYCDGNMSIKNLQMSNININSTNGYLGGIIGEYDSATKLVIENCKVTGNINGDNGSYVGGILGYIDENAEIEILNCINEATIKGGNNTAGLVGRIPGGTITIQDCANIANVNGTYDAGGIVGFTSSPTLEIKNCYNTGKISGISMIAGIIGRAGGTTTISNCYNTGDIKGDSSNYGSYIAGISGAHYGDNMEIQNCYNTGLIQGKGYTGGISGYSSKISISKSYNTGNIIGTDYYVGGISGCYGNISFCYNKGDVKGRYYVGGIQGQGDSSYVTENVYNLGDIISNYTDASMHSSIYVGGIAGEGKNIKNAYNLGEVKDESSSGEYINAGGIAGSLSGTIDNTYNLKKVTYKNEEATKRIGAITGSKSDTADLSTSYYLKGTYSVGAGYGTDASHEKETEADMKELMNTNLATLEGWKEDTENINNGYPILDF